MTKRDLIEQNRKVSMEDIFWAAVMYVAYAFLCLFSAVKFMVNRWEYTLLSLSYLTFSFFMLQRFTGDGSNLGYALVALGGIVALTFGVLVPKYMRRKD